MANMNEQRQTQDIDLVVVTNAKLRWIAAWMETVQNQDNANAIQHGMTIFVNAYYFFMLEAWVVRVCFQERSSLYAT